MEAMMLASATLDCVAVAAIGWIVRRSGRDREASLAAQRTTLERVRAELAELVADAERRARELDAALVARERSLRALVVDTAKVDATRRRPPESSEREATPRLRLDPAEARLLRDLGRA